MTKQEKEDYKEVTIMYMLMCGLEETIKVYSGDETCAYNKFGLWLFKTNEPDHVIIYDRHDMLKLAPAIVRDYNETTKA